MAKFELVPRADAEIQSATGKRADILREYLGYLEQLGGDQAGKLEAGEGETPSAVRRRLGAAAKVAGKELVIRRSGDDIYFWVKGRRSRPRKTPVSRS